MKPFKAITVYAVAILVLGALLAPWLFLFIAWLGARLPAVAGLAGQPFDRSFTRALLLVALAGLWPLFRTSGMGSWREFGYVRTNAWWREVLAGLAVGFGSLLLVGLLSLALGARMVTGHLARATIVARLLSFTASAVAVALIEETFFRGGLQGTLQRGTNPLTALLLTSAIYSALHFLKPAPMPLAPADVRWTSGFDCLARVVSRSLPEPGIAVGFVTLFLAGIILGLAFARTKRLYLSMGIHAGWVFALKSYVFFTDATPGWIRWLGAGSLIRNILSWPVLAVLVIVFWRIPLNREQITDR